MNKKRGFILMAAAVVVAVVVYEYPVLRFRGNARIWGGPVFGYTVKMRAIPFNHPGEYLFHLRGIPDGTMSLLLFVEGGADRDDHELTKPHTIIESLLVDGNGNIVCNFAGPPSEGQSGHTWALMSAYWGAAFWNWSCTHITLTHSTSYVLSLRVKDVDPSTPSLHLLPMLKSDPDVWP